MDNVGIEYWILIVVLSITILSVGAFVPTTLTCAICGYLMKGISVRRGLLTGLLLSIPPTVSIAQTRFGIAEWLQFIVELPIPTHAISVAATVGLCWWQHKRSVAGTQEEPSDSNQPGE